MIKIYINDKEKTTAKGLADGNTRHTFTVREDDLTYIRRVAYWERLDIREVLADAVELLRAKHGKQKPTPKE